MYPSNSYYASNNNNNDNLMSPYYTLDQTLANKPSIFEINPNSKSEDPLTSSFYNIPSPFYHYENNIFDQHMYEFNLQQQSQLIEVNAPNTISSDMGEHSDNVEDVLGESSSKHNESEVIKEIPKTRTSKKDRHSKIETAQGPRDRRMRLSLQVARPFFDLQDMLGYNKASKTVEWLLSKSKSAIQDLTKSSTHSPSSTSECEVFSQEKGIPLVSPTKEAKTNPRGSTRKSAFNPLTKESREKARARARERTIEKRKGDSSKNCFETTTSHQMDQLESWCRNGSNGCHFQELGNVGEPSSSAIFNYHTHENRTFEEHHFIDFDLYGKPWDAYNNTNLR